MSDFRFRFLLTELLSSLDDFLISSLPDCSSSWLVLIVELSLSSSFKDDNGGILLISFVCWRGDKHILGFLVKRFRENDKIEKKGLEIFGSSLLTGFSIVFFNSVSLNIFEYSEIFTTWVNK